MSAKISIEATTGADGQTVCKVNCNGQRAKLIFTGTEVLLDVPDPASPEES